MKQRSEFLSLLDSIDPQSPPSSTFKIMKSQLLDHHVISLWDLWDTVGLNHIDTRAWWPADWSDWASPTIHLAQIRTEEMYCLSPGPWPVQPPGFHIQALWVISHGKQVASFVGGLTYLQKCSWHIIQPQLTR